MKTDREAFEAWCPTAITKSRVTKYATQVTKDMWDAWQAAAKVYIHEADMTAAAHKAERDELRRALGFANSALDSNYPVFVSGHIAPFDAYDSELIGEVIAVIQEALK